MATNLGIPQCKFGHNHVSDVWLCIQKNPHQNVQVPNKNMVKSVKSPKIYGKSKKTSQKCVVKSPSCDSLAPVFRPTG
jgi:hypothetical protein